MAEYWKTDGEVEVLGTPFGGTDISDIRTKIGIVGSFIAERLPANMLAEKIVLTGKYKSSILYKEYGEKELDEARQMLISIGGEHLLGRIYASLSQGEKQLLLIACSLMENPEILILDEATSGLVICSICVNSFSRANKSSPLVASSKIKISGFSIKLRAIRSSCFSPYDRLA